MSKPTDNRKIFDNLVAIRSHDPLAFDNAHPFIGRLISDKYYLEEMQERLERHPARYKHYHPGGWRAVAGGHFETPLPGPIPPTCPPVKCKVIKEDCRPSVVPEPWSTDLLNTAIFLLLGILFVRHIFRERKS